MKICIHAPLFYNVGVAETAFQYSQMNNKEFNVVFAGYIEDKVANRISLIGKPDPIGSGDDNPNAKWYPITEENSRDVDLFYSILIMVTSLTQNKEKKSLKE